MTTATKITISDGNYGEPQRLEINFEISGMLTDDEQKRMNNAITEICEIYEANEVEDVSKE